MAQADWYLELRHQAEILIGSALDRVDMDPGTEREFLSHELALVAAEAERAIEGDEAAEGRIEAAMKNFLRHLTGRRARRQEKARDDANGQVEAAHELLAEVRRARRGMIEALREEISESGDAKAAQECCRLLEEEIGAARASKDAESESLATASLEIVRRLAQSEEGEGAEDYEAMQLWENATLWAETLTETRGANDESDLPAEGIAWFIRNMIELRKNRPELSEEAVVAQVLREYRHTERVARINAPRISSNRNAAESWASAA